MRISVPMIVKNEGRHIRQCLESVDGLADEIVVVDTGSTDDTMEVVQQFTDNVHRSQFFDCHTPIYDFHFGKARNEALERCTGDWIFSVDADEEIRDISLRDYLGRSKSPHHLVAMFSNASETKYHKVPRLARNEDLCWTYRVHELMWSQNGTIDQSVPPDVCHLFHADWTRKKQINAGRRNIALLTRQLRDCYNGQQSDLVATLYGLADEYAAVGEIEKAIAYYHAALTNFRDETQPVVAVIYAKLSQCYAFLKLAQPAYSCSRKALWLQPQAADMILQHAYICMLRGMADEAKEWIEHVGETKEAKWIGPQQGRHIDQKAVAALLRHCEKKKQEQRYGQ